MLYTPLVHPQLTNIDSDDMAHRHVTAIPSSTRKAITWHGTVCSTCRDIMRCVDCTTVFFHRVMDCQAIVAVIRKHRSKADNTNGGEMCTLQMTKILSYIFALIEIA
jgi:hypothetical protein